MAKKKAAPPAPKAASEDAPKKPQRKRMQFQGELIDPLDIDSLTLGEVEEIEEYFNLPISEVDWESGRATLFVAFIQLRRAGKNVTLDTLRKIPLAEFFVFEDVEPDEEAAPPTSAPSSEQAGEEEAAATGGGE